MWKNFGLILLLWLAARFAYQADFSQFAAALREGAELHRLRLLAAGVVVAVGLPAASLICRMVGGYGFFFMIARFFLTLGRFGICLLALGAVIIRLETGIDPWAALGMAALLPFLVLAGALAAIHLFDFNYPLRQEIILAVALPLASLLIVRLLPLAGF